MIPEYGVRIEPGKTLADYVSTYGNIVALSYQKIDVHKYRDLLLNHPEWKHYNPNKPKNKRYGLSVTSLDGGYSGVPDLTSLFEHWKQTGEEYHENDFQTRTPIVNDIPEVGDLLDMFGESSGRCHFLRLDTGGFFPPHRDHSWSLPTEDFRIIVPFYNFSKYNMTWIYDGVPVQLEEGRAYFMNTCREHSLVSYVDDCTMFVMNINANENSLRKLIANSFLY